MHRNPYEHDGDIYNPCRPQWQIELGRRDRERAKHCPRYIPKQPTHGPQLLGWACDHCGAPQYVHTPAARGY